MRTRTYTSTRSPSSCVCMADLLPLQNYYRSSGDVSANFNSVLNNLHTVYAHGGLPRASGAVFFVV